MIENTTREHNGRDYKVEIVPDDGLMGPPWKEHDLHGVVRENPHISHDGRIVKKPWERPLGTHYLYDMRASMAKARKEGWGVNKGKLRIGQTEFEREFWLAGLTEKQKIALAVEQDWQYLQDWCDDKWSWVGVVVSDDEGHTASLWGIESLSDPEFFEETIRDLILECQAQERKRA